MSERDQATEATAGETAGRPSEFDFAAYPPDTLFHERRTPKAGAEAAPPGLARRSKERRRRVDPTTFEKQYSAEELEFMNAMQDFKSHAGKPFPSHGEVLRVARDLGYAKLPEAAEGDPSA